MQQFCQAQKIHLFVPTHHHHQSHCHFLFPDAKNLIKTNYQKQVIPFKHFLRTIVLLALSLQIQNHVEALIFLCGSISDLKF